MNILLSGATGRMGKEIISCIEKDEDLTLTCGYSKEECFIRRYSNL